MASMHLHEQQSTIRLRDVSSSSSCAPSTELRLMDLPDDVLRLVARQLRAPKELCALSTVGSGFGAMCRVREFVH